MALRNIVLFIGSSVMMVVTSPRLSGFVIAAIPVIVLPLVAFGRLVRRRSRSAQDTLADASAYAAELIGAVRTLQAFTNEALATARFSGAVERAFEAARGSTRARAVLTAIVIFLVFGSVVVILWVGAQDVLAGRMTPGTLSQFVLYAVFAASGLGQLSETWGEISQAAGATERLVELLAVEPAITAPALPVALPVPPRGEVAFAAVRFAYPTRPETFVLDGVSLSVRAGREGRDRRAFRRRKEHDLPSDPAPLRPAGRRRDLRRRAREGCHRSALRQRVALVPQDAVVFAASVAENIRFGRPTRPTPTSPAPPSWRRPPNSSRGCRNATTPRSASAASRCRGRAAPAHRHRARHPARRSAAAAGRGDILARRRKRAARADRAHAADAGPHHARDRASPGDRALL